MSIVHNRKASHDYFIEERYEAGLVLAGWEVKAIRAGRATIGEAYVMVRGEEIFLIGANISPLPSASTHYVQDPTRTAQAAAARRGDPPADRQGGAARLHAGAARPALQQRGASRSRSRWRKASWSTTSAPTRRRRSGPARSSALLRSR
jgi:hypothetical protein